MSDSLKLLAAKMREGAALTAPLKGMYMGDTGYRATCALGAIGYACGYRGNNWPDIRSTILRCIGIDLNEEHLVKNPVTGEIDRVNSVIMRLNDDHDWSRERIAEWLESL